MDMIAVLQIVQVIRRRLVFEARVDEQEGAFTDVPGPADDVQHHVAVLTSAYAHEGMFMGCEDVGARQKGIIREQGWFGHIVHLPATTSLPRDMSSRIRDV